MTFFENRPLLGYCLYKVAKDVFALMFTQNLSAIPKNLIKLYDHIDCLAYAC